MNNKKVFDQMLINDAVRKLSWRGNKNEMMTDSTTG